MGDSIQVASSFRSIIFDEIARIGQQQRRTLAPLTDDLPLLDSGLDSLCIAVLIASLDERTGLDPFGDDASGPFPVTLGDFIGYYERASL